MSTAFYHTSGDTPAAVDAALPPLLAKALEAGHKLALIAPSAERMHRLDEALWSYQPASFMPHATLEDTANPARQPVLLLTTEETAEASQHLAGRIPVLLAGTEAAQPNLPQAERTLYLFHNHPDVVQTARSFFKTLKGQGVSPAYWQQTSRGWQQKTGA